MKRPLLGNGDLKSYFIAKFSKHMFGNENNFAVLYVKLFENVSIFFVIESQGIGHRITVPIFLTNNLNLLCVGSSVKKCQTLLCFITPEERFEFVSHHVGVESPSRHSFPHGC